MGHCAVHKHTVTTFGGIHSKVSDRLLVLLFDYGLVVLTFVACAYYYSVSNTLSLITVTRMAWYCISYHGAWYVKIQNCTYTIQITVYTPYRLQMYSYTY